MKDIKLLKSEAERCKEVNRKTENEVEESDEPLAKRQRTKGASPSRADARRNDRMLIINATDTVDGERVFGDGTNGFADLFSPKNSETGFMMTNKMLVNPTKLIHC